MFPVMLSLGGRRCLVVGGGSVALRKARSLLDEGAAVTVVAPEALPELDELARAMSGLVAGPKGALLEGQTDVLEVVEVRLDYPIR